MANKAGWSHSLTDFADQVGEDITQMARVIATARQLQPAKIVVVYGHGGEQVREQNQDPDIAWALQAEQQAARAQAVDETPSPRLR